MPESVTGNALEQLEGTNRNASLETSYRIRKYFCYNPCYIFKNMMVGKIGK